MSDTYGTGNDYADHCRVDSAFPAPMFDQPDGDLTIAGPSATFAFGDVRVEGSEVTTRRKAIPYSGGGGGGGGASGDPDGGTP